MNYTEAYNEVGSGECRKLECMILPFDQQFRLLDQNKEMNIFEIGSQYGGGLKVLKKCFPNSTVIGLDINSKCEEFTSKKDNIKIYIGDQSNVGLLSEIIDTHGNFDLIVDDGGHTMVQQKETFNYLFPKMNVGGLYVIEDTHTSYWPQFGRDNHVETTMAYFQRLAEYPTSQWATRHKRAKDYKITDEPPWLEKNIKSIHFYDSLIFIWRRDEEL